MKKIIALVLVLAVAQFASAAISWNVTQTASDTFSVSLVSDENVQDVSLAQLVSSGTTFAVSPLGDAGIWVGNFGGAATAGFMDLSAFGSTGFGAAMGQNTAAGQFATGTLVTFTVTGALNDVITVQDLTAFGVNAYVTTQAGGNQSIAAFDGGSLSSFTLVPEPMTMALLGLGGLFIRRRRA